MPVGQTSEMMALRDPDIRLMLRVREDDPAAFAELVARYQHRLIAVLHHVVGNRAEAEDLAQEVFLRVYRHRKKYRPHAKFATWLFTIANNLALNFLRRRQRRPTQPLELSDSGSLRHEPVADQAEFLAASSPAAQQLHHQELTDVVRRALDSLNDRQRLAIVLNKFEDMNYADIARVMGLTVKAVKSLLSRARTKLRIALAGYIYMDGQPHASPPPPACNREGDPLTAPVRPNGP